MRRNWPLLFLAIVPLIPLWRTVVVGDAIGPFDEIRQMAPWSVPAVNKPWDVLQADAVLQFYVWRDLVFESWGKGQIPLWNNYEVAGTPLLANSQSGGFYPPHILMGLLKVPTPLAITILAWFHLLWAGLGIYALCGRLGANSFGSAIAGASFSLSAFMLAWTPLASVITTVSWIPWLLASVLALVATERVDRPLALGCAAVCAGMMLLGGHLQFAAYGLIGAVFVGLAALPWKYGVGSSLALLLAFMLSLGLGGLIASPQVLPTLEFSQHSHRRGPPTEEGYQAYVAGAIRPVELSGVIVPSFLGSPVKVLEIKGQPPSQSQSTSTSMPVLSTFWPALSHRGSNFAECAASLGPLIFLGLLFVPWRRLPTGGIELSALGIFALLMALGTPLNRLFYFFIPGWNSTGSPGRMIVLFVLAGCVLGGLGFSELAKGEFDAARIRKVLRAGGLLLAAYVVAAMISTGNVTPWFGEGAALDLVVVARTAIFDSLPGLLVVLLLSTIGIQLTALKPNAGQFLIALAAAAIPIALLGPQFMRTGKPELGVGTQPAASERIAIVNNDWQLLVPPANAFLVPNLPAALRIHEISGYDSLMHADSVGILKEINQGVDPAPEANGNMLFVKPGFDAGRLAEAGVTEVWSRKDLQGLGEPLAPVDPEAPTGAIFRYRLPGPGRAYTPQGPAEIREEGFDRLLVKAVGPGKLVVKDRMMDGWSATLGGNPVAITGTLWREVELPPGDQFVEFNYMPPSINLWAAAAGLGIVVLLVAISAGKNRL